MAEKAPGSSRGTLHRLSAGHQQLRAVQTSLIFPVWIPRFQHLCFFRQGRGCASLLHLGSLDPAAFPLRPTHVAWLGFLFRDRARQHFPGRDHYHLHAEIGMNLEARKPGKEAETPVFRIPGFLVSRFLT